jgi:hypothetical protein
LGLKKKIFFNQMELSVRLVLFAFDVASLQCENVSGVEWCIGSGRDATRKKEFQASVKPAFACLGARAAPPKNSVTLVFAVMLLFADCEHE